MKLAICLTMAALTISARVQARAEETSHLAFVTEYVRELAENEDKRTAAEQELASASTQNEKLSSAIHSSTMFQLGLRSQVGILKSMRLAPPFDTLISNIIQFDQQKIDLYQTMIDISSAFLAGPKPAVDYGNMAIQMPKIRAVLEEIDQTMFNISPMIFATLIDKRPDSQNHVSRLVVTKSERDELVNNIATSFGTKIDEKNQDYTVNAASVLKAYLLKDYKCADDP